MNHGPVFFLIWIMFSLGAASWAAGQEHFWVGFTFVFLTSGMIFFIPALIFCYGNHASLREFALVCLENRGKYDLKCNTMYHKLENRIWSDE